MRKKHINRFLILTLAATLLLPPQSVYATSSAEIQKQREEKEREKANTQQELNQINSEIGDISGEIADVDTQIEELNTQITEVLASISLMEEELAETEAQLEQAQMDYDEAKSEEEAQYAAMKKRIQYLYEKGQDSYLQVFLSARSLGDALNKAEYVQELYTYDQKMLDDYAAIVEEVAQLQSSLEDQKSEIEACQYELGLEEEYLEEMLEEQKAIAADYEVQLARAKQEAAAYKARIKQQNAEIKQLAAAEEAKRKEEEEAKRKEEEERKKAEEAAKQASGGNGSNSSSSESGSGSGGNSSGSSGSGNSGSGSGSGSGGSYTKIGTGTGSDIAQFACQFVGNPYVAGGTSLTNGADCSGFTQAVYRVYGYSLPRTSGQQRSAGREVSYAEAQPGDLICYAGHVAIYLGNGRIVHASSARTGIKYGYATYKTILSVRRIVN